VTLTARLAAFEIGGHINALAVACPEAALLRYINISLQPAGP
jgi:hypothetical protein